LTGFPELRAINYSRTALRAVVRKDLRAPDKFQKNVRVPRGPFGMCCKVAGFDPVSSLQAAYAVVATALGAIGNGPAWLGS
jgi:hypothetical protein